MLDNKEIQIKKNGKERKPGNPGGQHQHLHGASGPSRPFDYAGVLVARNCSPCRVMSLVTFPSNKTGVGKVKVPQ